MKRFDHSVSKARLDAAAARFSSRRSQEAEQDDKDEDEAAAHAIAQFWELSGQVSERPSMHWLRAEALAADGQVSTGNMARASGWKWPMALAASLALLIGGAFYFGHGDFLDQGSDQFATRVGEQKTVILTDGSTVLLDTRSRFEPFAEPGLRGGRLLEGRALFQVKHDPSRPFKIFSAGGETVALGTRFVVDTSTKGVGVTLLNGSVEVRCFSCRATSDHVRLAPGQQAYYSRGSQVTLVKQVQAINSASDWTAGQLTFDDSPIEDVVAQLSRYTPHPIRVASSAKGQRVTGVFHIDDSAQFVSVLTTAMPVTAKVQHDGSILVEK
ncbi:FecR family protein [Sphingobium sp.]|uniref:FecR family protein n=1 Tax=Sphingobium sp. TaxID=1912891 RepID=UPI002C7B876F|nr:FecR domain-containing protein [Sphingobium sp.]HUD92896.1 FecR domain-containing protein [Sphingobium sp.]